MHTAGDVFSDNLFCLQVAPQFCLRALSVMCSVARLSPCQDTTVMAAAAHARRLATLRCMNAPKMDPTLAAPVSVAEDSPRSWEVGNATACIEASKKHFIPSSEVLFRQQMA